MTQSKMEEKAKIDYDITSDRWSRIISVIRVMLIVLSIIYVTCIIISLASSQFIAAFILLILQILNLLGLNSINIAKNKGSIKDLYLPIRILAILLGVIY